MIPVYGDKAEKIQDGDLFEARIKYVEGRKVVELIPVDAETVAESFRERSRR
jgi:hypothetical protein